MAVMQKNHIYLLNGQQILKTDTLEAAEDGFTAAFYDMEELEKLCLQGRYPQQLFNEGKNLRITKLEEYEESVLCALCVPIKSDILKSHAKFTILIRKDQMIFALYNREAEELLETFTPSRPAKGMTPERFLYEYLGSLLESDLAFLGELENQITRLEERTLNNMLDNFNRKIVKVRKELMYLHSFYAQLLDLAEGLEANEYDYFESGRYFDHLSKRVERLCQYAELLREYSVQIRDIYQAQIDVRQNQTMKLLTVVSTIFLPLSLIAGWYGMNFVNMPELEWKYGYPAVAVISIAVALICIWYFKKKKMF